MLGGAALLLVFTVVVVVSLLETRTVTASLQEVKTRLRPRAEAAYEIEINVYEVSSAVLGYLADPDTLKLRSFNDARVRLDSVVATYARLSKSDHGVEPSTARRLRDDVARYDSASALLVQRRTRGPFPSVSVERAARTEYRARRDRLDTLLDREIQPGAIEEWHARAGVAQSASERQAVVVLTLAVVHDGVHVGGKDRLVVVVDVHRRVGPP